MTKEPHILCSYEYEILEHAKNETRPEIHGAAFNAALEVLVSNQYITKSLKITEKGLAILASRR